MPAKVVPCGACRGIGHACVVLDGVASRQTAEYLKESLLAPSKVLAKGYEGLSMSPMPPMGDVFTPQELADLEAFLGTLH